MKTIDQILDLIDADANTIIGIRGDNHEYEYLDYTKDSMHFLDNCRDFEGQDDIPEAKELDGTCGFLLWESGQTMSREYAQEKLAHLIEEARNYGKYVHILRCDSYEHGWDDNEIVMKGAWVVGRI